MNSLNPLTLSFRSPEVEQAFTRHSFPRTLMQGRAAIMIGTLVYFMYGLLDHRFLTTEQLGSIWNIRLLAVWVPAFVLLLSFHPIFKRFHPFLLALVGLIAGLGLIAKLWYLPVEVSPYYFPALLIVTIFLYNLLGIRFIHALILNTALFLIYNAVFAFWHEYPLQVLISHNFFFIAANLMGGTAGYLGEHQSRQLYVRQMELDAERRLHLRRSLHDRLTGLPNRQLLTDRINRTLAKTRRNTSLHAGMFIDLDGFKAINDGEGHDRGDQVLRKTARRLQRAVREADTVARIGGDEFFVLAQDIGSPENASQLAGKLLAFIEKPISGFPPSLGLSASIGICLFPIGGEDNEEASEADETEVIIRLADHAMYRAKAAGKGRFAFAKQGGAPLEKR